MITYCGITLETCFSQNVFGTHLCTSSLIPSSNNMKLKYISKYIEEKKQMEIQIQIQTEREIQIHTCRLLTNPCIT